MEVDRPYRALGRGINRTVTLRRDLMLMDIHLPPGPSVETVRVHLKRIYDKLHVHSRTEAALKFRDLRPGP